MLLRLLRLSSIFITLVMADETLKKRAYDKSLHVCRCCGVSTNQRVYLFGQKARNEGILTAIQEFAKKEILSVFSSIIFFVI